MEKGFEIRSVAQGMQSDWLALRKGLWPDCSDDEHLDDMAVLLARPDRYAQFLAYDKQGHAAGFIEASIRHDYVNGTQSSPVGFVEGLYTLPDMRRKGVAAMLMRQAERWAKAKGCTEMASDALADNMISHEMHKALGFEQTEQVVYFYKKL